jgi:hypothetical protein
MNSKFFFILYLFCLFKEVDMRISKIKNLKNSSETFRKLKEIRINSYNNKPTLISIKTLKKLVKKGYKRKLRKLFSENKLKVYLDNYTKDENFLKSNLEKAKFVERTVIGALGIMSPFFLKYMNLDDLKDKNDEKIKKIKLAMQDNSKKRTDFLNYLKNIDKFADNLEEKISKVERNLRELLYNVRGQAEKMLKKEMHEKLEENQNQ